MVSFAIFTHINDLDDYIQDLNDSDLLLLKIFSIIKIIFSDFFFMIITFTFDILLFIFVKKNMIKKNTINLVYDDWLDIYNTNQNGKKHFPDLHFGDMHHLMWSYLDKGLFFGYLQNTLSSNDKFELKKC